MNSSEEASNQKKRFYPFIPVVLIFSILYALTHLLSKKKIITPITHKKIWNILLLITFLISGILGIFLVLKVNLGIVVPLPFNSLYWHVEAGITMALISIFHIIWHWRYFRNITKF